MDVGLAPPSALADYMHSISGLCPSVQRGSLWMGWGQKSREAAATRDGPAGLRR